jgi:hypothetical protein
MNPRTAFGLSTLMSLLSAILAAKRREPVTHLR